jgi:hypothetical protein
MAGPVAVGHTCPMTSTSPGTHESPDAETLYAHGLAHIRRSPTDVGRLEMIVCRPAAGEREVLTTGVLDPAHGLIGDSWSIRGSRRSADGGPHPEMQVTLMNSRVIELLAGGRERWSLAGDQLYVDFDLGERNLAPGSHVTIGSTVLEVTAEPHRGCAKFSAHFGRSAVTFVNSPLGLDLRLRGVNAKVIEGGTIEIGDPVAKR